MNNRLVQDSFAGKLKLGTITSALDAVHPSLASRFARYLFLKPLNYSARPDEAKILEEGVELELAVKNYKLRGWRWGSGPAVLFVHGWSGSPAQYHRMIKEITSRGFSAIGFEMPGHGESTGNSPTLLDFKQAIQGIAQIYGPFVGAVGHSLGALAVVMAAQEQSIARRLILVSPLAKARGGLTTFSRLTGISLSVLQNMQRSLEDETGVLFSECELEHLSSQISVPMLAIHDRGDRMSPYEPVNEWASVHPEVTFLETQGYGHQKILISDEVIDAFSGFLEMPKTDLRLDSLTEFAL